MALTLFEALSRHQITVADDLLADIEVPVLSGVPQRQGDVLVIPRAHAGKAELDAMTPVGRSGVPVVRGEATGNTHLLDAVQGDVRWKAHAGQDGDLTLGVLYVGPDSVANLLHTDEHGCNAIGPGTYTLHGKREMADEIRRVAD
jgi:hypothetical protein